MATIGTIFGLVQDVTGLVQLCFQINGALNDVAGASAEWRALAQDVLSLIKVLSLVRDATSCASQVVITRFEGTLQSSLDQCHTLLEDIVETISGYQLSLQSEGSGNWIKDTFKKVYWALSSKKKIKITGLQTRLGNQLAGMNVILQLLQVSSLDKLLKKAESSHEILLNIQSTIQRIPRQLGYPFQGDNGSDYIQLVDSFSMSWSLPLQICPTLERFQSFLRWYYQDRPEQAYIESGDYDIRSGSGHILVTTLWASEVMAGMVVKLNIVICIQDADRRKCPNCDFADVRPSNTMEGIVCKRCNTWFKISDEAQINEVPARPLFETMFEPDVPEAEEFPTVQSRPGFFRRIRVVPVLLSTVFQDTGAAHIVLDALQSSEAQGSDDVSGIPNRPPISSPAKRSNPAHQLDNYLQVTRQSHLLRWEILQAGPLHHVTHYATAYLGNRVIGRGQGTTRAGAKQAAANLALAYLRAI